MALTIGYLSIGTIVLCFNVMVISLDPAIPFDFKHVQILTAESLTSLQQTPSVSVVYYYKRDLARLRAFFKELDKSAEYLEIYGTKTGILDCNTVDESVGNCGVPRVEHNVYSYREGGELLTLELETMFDVNSIMSNILQLILLHEVPIVQSRSDRQQLELQHKGKSDIIFSFHKAIGTYEHRVFMEVAYAYQDRYKFAITTETKTAEGLKELDQVTPQTEAAVWVLYCQGEEEGDKGCPSIRYRGKMDLTSLAIFLKALSLPKIFEVPEHGRVPPCQKEKFPCVMLYYNTDSKTQVMEAADALKFNIYGHAGIVVVDMDKVDVSEHHGFVKAPAIGVLKTGQTKPTVMEEEWSLDNIPAFIQRVLFEGEPADADSGQGESGDERQEVNQEKRNYIMPTVEEVETQDDQVAEAVFQLKRVPLQLNLVPALTDKTFPTTVQERSLVSVLFYLPFDARSMAFLRAYGEASYDLNQQVDVSPLTRMNCFDWTDVCGQQNITHYPTVRIFRQGQDPMDYLGALDTEAVVSTVKLLQQSSPMELTSQSEAQMFVGGKLPENITSFTNMSVLGLFTTENEGLAAFKEAAEMSHSITVFAYMLGDMASTIASQLGQKAPCVLVFRHDDPYSDSEAVAGALTAQNIYSLVQATTIPTMPELTMEIFPLLYSQDKPMLILFCDKYETAETSDIKNTVVSLKPSFPNIIFTWMHARGSSIGATVFSEYTASPNLPALSVVYHRTGEVFNMDDGGYSVESIGDWLNKVTGDQEQPSLVLPKGDWKPAGRGYDFLALSEYESKYGESPMNRESTESLDTAEQHGIGFNKDGSEIEFNNVDLNVDDTKSTNTDDDDIRSELVELHKSRLYHQVPEKRHDDGTKSRDTDQPMKQSEKEDLKSKHPDHTEL